ncbi:MAG: DUF2065 domain-containing protein [Alphaproteobacteria bacterium]
MSTELIIAIFTAIGLVLVIEGLVLTLAPGAIRRVWEMMQEISNDGLRRLGLGAIMIGVLIVWIARG